jgi:hypothetical protein
VSSQGPIPLFHGQPVLVTYAPGLAQERVLQAAIWGLVGRLERAHVGESALVIRVVELVAEHGLSARLTAWTPDAIEFAVSNGDPDGRRATSEGR